MFNSYIVSCQPIIFLTALGFLFLILLWTENRLDSKNQQGILWHSAEYSGGKWKLYCWECLFFWWRASGSGGYDNMGAYGCAAVSLSWRRAGILRTVQNEWSGPGIYMVCAGIYSASEIRGKRVHQSAGPYGTLRMYVRAISYLCYKWIIGKLPIHYNRFLQFCSEDSLKKGKNVSWQLSKDMIESLIV